MKISRQKRVNKLLNFYCNNFGFRKPYQVLIDGTFCHSALKNKVKIREQIPKYLGDVKLLTTPCVIIETELLGKPACGAMIIVKQFSIHKCKHINKPVSGSKCFEEMIGENNPSRYIIATQDRDLQEVVRRIPGTPLMYLHLKTPHLEEPSRLTAKVATDRANNRFGVSEVETKKLTSLKTNALGEEKEEPIKKKKRKGGPNPLSCKKKKKTPTEPAKSTTDTKKRTRKRIKVPKHIKEHLLNN